MAKKKLSARAELKGATPPNSAPGQRLPLARRERREAARAAEKLRRAREALARLEPGGAAARPVEVESASQIEPHALAVPCLRCDGALRLDEHAAVTVGAERLRLVKLHCPQCGTRREVWFHIGTALPS